MIKVGDGMPILTPTTPSTTKKVMEHANETNEMNEKDDGTEKVHIVDADEDADQDENEEAQAQAQAAMALTMGFSSFGQPTVSPSSAASRDGSGGDKKRRRYNDYTFVAPSVSSPAPPSPSTSTPSSTPVEPASVDGARKKHARPDNPSRSGSNAMPLGGSKTRGPSPLEGKGERKGSTEKEDPPASASEPAQAPAQHGSTNQVNAGPVASLPSHPLPPHPSHAPSMQSPHTPSSRVLNRPHQRNGVWQGNAERDDGGYYDASFVEDPWLSLRGRSRGS